MQAYCTLIVDRFWQFCLVGMKAVCSGPGGCKRNNNENCVLTPLSFDCYNPMWDLM